MKIEGFRPRINARTRPGAAARALAPAFKAWGQTGRHDGTGRIAAVHRRNPPRSRRDRGLGGAPPVGISECSSNAQLPVLPFEFDRAEITPQSVAILDALVDHLNLCENVRVRIDGYTDQTGTDWYNRALSERRSRAAHRYLIEAGIYPGRLTARGLGAADPIASNGTEEGRSLNRRVDLVPVR